MEKITKQLRWLLASLLLVVGVGTISAQDPYYTLTVSSETQTNSNAYAGEGTVTVNDIVWHVNGNGQQVPWRIGGKNISDTDRVVYTGTAMGSAISKVVLTVGTANNITVNSLKLTIASDASFSNVIEEVTGTFKASSDITFEPSNGQWATGAYYKFTFNVSVSGNTNRFVQFSGVKFYAAAGANTVATPTISPDGGSFITSQEVAITCSTSGATIQYSTDDGATWQNYTSPFTINETTTVKAKATKSGMTESGVATATFTKAAVITSLQALQEATTSTTQDMVLQLTNVYVTAVKNANAWITDGTYGALIYTTNHGLSAGQKLNGILTAKHVLYRGQTEITNFSTEGLTITEDAFSPVEVTDLSTLTGANQSLLVTLKNVTYNGSTLEDENGNTITPYNTFISDLGLVSGKTYDITGIVILFNTTLEIAPRTSDDIVEAGEADTRTDTHIVFLKGQGTAQEEQIPSGSNIEMTVGDDVVFTQARMAIFNSSDQEIIKITTQGEITYTVDNTELGTVNEISGEVTLVAGATGTLTVTATYAGSNDYKPCTGYYTLKVKPEEVTPTGTGDEITYDFVGVTGNSYTTWEGKTGTSGAVYAGQTAGGNTSVQMRSTNPSGIVTTTSAGKVTMVTVEWNTATSSSRTLDIYGSNEPYTSAADLYSASTQGTKLGSICIDDATQLVITGDYAYIGIRSNSGAVWCNKITIYWETTPDERTATTTTFSGEETYNVTLGETFNAPTATLSPAAAGTLTYESSDETVATVAANGAVTILAAGTTTIKAKFAGNDDYKPSEDSYTLIVTAPATVYTSLQQLQENVTSTSQDFTLQMTDIYVTAVKGTNNAYLSDGTYGALIYTNNHGLTAGQKLNGTLSAKFVLYKGATEITNFDATGLTITDGTLAVQTKTIGEITVANQSLPVKFENVTYDAANTQFSDGTNTIKYYNNFSVSPAPTLVDGHQYDITGIIVMYNNLQIAPLSASDVVDVTPAVAVEAPVFSPGGGTYTEDKEVYILCETEGAVIYYTTDGTDPTWETGTEYTDAILITETTTLKAIAYLGEDESEITTAEYIISRPETPYALNYGTEYYVKVTSLDQLQNGDAVIIVNETGKDDVSKALNTTQQNNRKASEFDWLPWIDGNLAQLDAATDIEKFILVKEGDYYYFYASRGTTDGYIYMAGASSSNYLKTQAAKDDNAKASIDMAANGDVTITFQGSGTRNTLKYNKDADLFSCYTSSSTQQPVQLYVERPTAEAEAEKTVTVAAAQDNYKTFVTPYVAAFTGANEHAYIVTLNETQTEANLTEVTIVPAGTPIIYKNDNAGTYNITRAASSKNPDDVSANELKVSRGEIVGDAETIFVLNKNPEIGFYLLKSGNTLASGKCYLEIEKADGAKFIGINFEGEATGIAGLESANDKLQGTVYNLAGQRVTTPAHGLYIVNGKKVLIK